MRIVAGELRGRTLQAPDGSDTRPTTDRVREALFSSLYSMRGGFEDAYVLDAFAGSGALGLEALSRGAAGAVFYERDSKAVAVLRRNVESCGLRAGRAEVLARDVMRSGPSGERPFDLVMLDPPYAYDPRDVLGMVRDAVRAGSVGADAIVVYEHALKSKEEVLSAAESLGFGVRSTKKYGKSAVTLLRAEADAPCQEGTPE